MSFIDAKVASVKRIAEQAASASRITDTLVTIQQTVSQVILVADKVQKSATGRGNIKQTVRIQKSIEKLTQAATRTVTNLTDSIRRGTAS